MLIATFAEWWDLMCNAYTLYLVAGLLILPTLVFSVIASIKVNTTFNKYARVNSGTGKTAALIAREILDQNGLQKVIVKKIRGSLTDNYNPSTHVLSLSESVYGSTSVAAIGVACHEVGHAIQHSQNYLFSTLRSKLVPVLNFSNRLLWPIFILGYIFGFMYSDSIVGEVFMWIGVILFGGSLLFSLVTLPTEFDASRRAQRILKEQYLSPQGAAATRKVLTAAAMTYVASFLMASLQFLRILALLLLARGRRD